VGRSSTFDTTYQDANTGACLCLPVPTNNNPAIKAEPNSHTEEGTGTAAGEATGATIENVAALELTLYELPLL